MSIRAGWGMCLVLVSALLGAPAATAPASAAGATSGTVAGVTTIRASGIAGVVLSVPQTTGIVPGSADLQLRNGTFAHVFLATHDATPPPEACGWCIWDSFTVIPEVEITGGRFGFDGFCSEDSGAPKICELSPGPLEVYVISDGDVTFSASFDGLGGATTVTATGKVDARLEKLQPRGCPGGDCDRWAYGGVTHEVGADGPGRVLGFAYAQLPRSVLEPNISHDGSVSVAGCSYPSYYTPSGSPDPEDHPTGCDLTPDPRTAEWDRRLANTYGAAAATASAQGMFFGSLEISGPAYAGFNLRNHSPGETQGRQGAWAMWIDHGIQ